MILNYLFDIFFILINNFLLIKNLIKDSIFLLIFKITYHNYILQNFFINFLEYSLILFYPYNLY